MNKQKLREIKLLELLKSRERLDVATVTSELTVSEATAHRLFVKLEAEKKYYVFMAAFKQLPNLVMIILFVFQRPKTSRQKRLLAKLPRQWSKVVRVYLWMPEPQF